MRTKSKVFFTGAIILMLLVGFTGAALAFDSGGNPGVVGPNTITWTGQGADGGVLGSTLCGPNDTPDGIANTDYLHWVFTTDGGSASGATLYLDGTGTGSFLPYKISGNMFHFYTPYYTPDTALLIAYVNFTVGEPGGGTWNLTISHGCAGGGGFGGANLSVHKTAVPSYTRTYFWDLSKDVDQTLIEQSGVDATFHYTVDAWQTGFEDSDWAVTGDIIVTNPNLYDVEDVVVSDETPGGDCTVYGSPLTVPADSDATVTYVCTFTSNPDGGTNTATATWDAVIYDTPLGVASGTAIYTFGAPTELVDEVISVSDSYAGYLGKLTATDEEPYASESFTYDREVTGTPGTCTDFDNTALFTTNDTLTTGEASASVTLCVGADLTVEKTANPFFTRTYTWDISKDVDKTLVKKIGGTATFNYTVNARQTGFSDSDWAVTGTISVYNPNDWENITLTDLSDVVDNGGSCVVDPGPYEVLASGSLDVNYSCTFTSGASGTNTATATWVAATYFTPNGSASGEADFDFTTPTTTVDKTITVTDTFNGVTSSLGTLIATDASPYASRTFTYSHTVNVPTWNCVSYTNTARIVETGQSASQTVTVCGPIKTGALTMGFWQNKNGQALIKNVGFNLLYGCDLTPFLRTYAPFQNLGAWSSCSTVATYVTNVIKAANASGTSMNAMLKAQMLATALDVYFFNIGGYSIDLTMICTNMTCIAFEDSSSAFGGTPKTISEMLTYAASQSNVGGTMWYGNVKATQELAKDAFDAINNQKVFGAP